MWGLGANVAANQGSSYDGGSHSYGVPAVAKTNRNVFFGQQVPGNTGSIVWLGIPVDPPGTVRPSRVFRITNVRANASSLIVAGPNQPPTAITSTISISPPTALPLNNFSAQLTVGFAAKGLLSSESAVTTFKQCTDVNSSGRTIAVSGSAPNGADNAGGVTIPVGYDPGLLSDAVAAQGRLGSVGGGFFIGGGYFPALRWTYAWATTDFQRFARRPRTQFSIGFNF